MQAPLQTSAEQQRDQLDFAARGVTLPESREREVSRPFTELERLTHALGRRHATDGRQTNALGARQCIAHQQHVIILKEYDHAPQEASA